MDEQSRPAKTRRPYHLRQRQEAMDETRRRITQAAVELHGSVGPAATTMSAVAELAGVTRATLYRHFANEAALFAACSADWRAQHPLPDLQAWAAVADPVARLRRALFGLYSWYRETEAMTGNLLRDAEHLPPGFGQGPRTLPILARDALLPGWEPADATILEAAIGHAVRFETWRSLAHEGLADEAIVELMTRFVAASARSRISPARSR